MKKQKAKKEVSWDENTFTPALAVCDQKRIEWFTNYDMKLMQEIRRIKLNEDGKERNSCK
jgi:hypothetical protein